MTTRADVKIARMIRPAVLAKDVRLVWSAGSGTDVWGLFCACIAGEIGEVHL